MTPVDETSFQTQGFVVLDGILPLTDISDFQAACTGLIERQCAAAALTYEASGSVAARCNAGLLALAQSAPDRLRDTQRLIARLPEFYRLSSNKALSDALRGCLGKDAHSPLYLISNVPVMSFPPGLAESSSAHFQTPWHNDVYWTIPHSRFAHIWIPLLQDVDEALGPLEFCVGSHAVESQHAYTFNPQAGYNYRFGIDPAYVDAFEKQVVPVALGQVLLFHQHILHRSTPNTTTDRVRMTMLGMYHDATQAACVPGTPSLKFVGKTPEQAYYERFGDESVVPFLTEQLDTTIEPPTGI